MKSVSYLRPRANFTRTLRVKDLAQLGIEHKEDLVFSPANQFTIVLSNKTSDSLVAALPKEFKGYPIDGDDEIAVDENTSIPSDDSDSSESTVSDDSTSSESEDDPESSLGEEDAPSASSTPRARRNR